MIIVFLLSSLFFFWEERVRKYTYFLFRKYTKWIQMMRVKQGSKHTNSKVGAAAGVRLLFSFVPVPHQPL